MYILEEVEVKIKRPKSKIDLYFIIHTQQYLVLIFEVPKRWVHSEITAIKKNKNTSNQNWHCGPMYWFVWRRAAGWSNVLRMPTKLDRGLLGIAWYCMVMYGEVLYCMVLYGIVSKQRCQNAN